MNADEVLDRPSISLRMRVPSLFLLLPVRVLNTAFRFTNCVQSYSSYSTTTRRVVFMSTAPSNEESAGCFLLKSEPSAFSIQDLEKAGEEEWDGVRNFQARNILRTMKGGDKAFFYHSNCKQAGIVGTVRITREAQPDVTAYQDANHPGYDSKSTADNCRWDAVRVRLDTIYPVTVTLKEIKAQAKHNHVLSQMTLLKNSRLSVQKLSREEWAAVEDLIDRKVAGEDFLETT